MTWSMWHIGVSMVVADGLAPIWHQDICNHPDDMGQSVYLKSGAPK